MLCKETLNEFVSQMVLVQLAPRYGQILTDLNNLAVADLKKSITEEMTRQFKTLLDANINKIIDVQSASFIENDIQDTIAMIYSQCIFELEERIKKTLREKITVIDLVADEILRKIIFPERFHEIEVLVLEKSKSLQRSIELKLQAIVNTESFKIRDAQNELITRVGSFS